MADNERAGTASPRVRLAGRSLDFQPTGEAGAGATPSADAEPAGSRGSSTPRHGGRGPGRVLPARAGRIRPPKRQGCRTQRRKRSRITLVPLRSTYARGVTPPIPFKSRQGLGGGTTRGTQRNAASIGALRFRRNSFTTLGGTPNGATASQSAERQAADVVRRPAANPTGAKGERTGWETRRARPEGRRGDSTAARSRQGGHTGRNVHRQVTARTGPRRRTHGTTPSVTAACTGRSPKVGVGRR